MSQVKCLLRGICCPNVSCTTSAAMHRRYGTRRGREYALLRASRSATSA